MSALLHRISVRTGQSSSVCECSLIFSGPENESLRVMLFPPYSLAPIFQVSSVTGKNLRLLERFLNMVPPLHSRLGQEQREQQHTKFQVDEIYSVPEAGTVLGGVLTR